MQEFAHLNISKHRNSTIKPQHSGFSSGVVEDGETAQQLRALVPLWRIQVQLPAKLWPPYTCTYTHMNTHTHTLGAR